jgi:hypothetical protein
MTKTNRSTDAELVKLGEALADLSPAYFAALDEVNEKGDRAHELAYDRAGGRTSAFSSELDRADAETGTDKAWEKYDSLDKQTDIIARKMMRIPARTAAGLRAKTILAMHTCRWLWNKPFDDLDWDKKGMRSLIEAVCSVMALEAPMEKVDESKEKLRRPLAAMLQ